MDIVVFPSIYHSYLGEPAVYLLSSTKFPSVVVKLTLMLMFRVKRGRANNRTGVCIINYEC